MWPALAIVVGALATLTGASAGTPRRQDTPGPALNARSASRVRELRFEGDLAFDRDVLDRVLSDLEIRRVIPLIWTRRPKYEPRRVEADLARLRAFYASHGYFDARVELARVTVDGGDATLTLEVHSGPQYSVRHVRIDGMDGMPVEVLGDPGGEFPADSLCSSLFEVRRVAESHGRIDFDVEAEVSPTNGSASVDITARVRTGPPYTLGRIDFSGHHRINESTLRRAIALREHSLFDAGKLRASLARLNRSGLFEPLTLDDVEVRRNPETLTADVTIAVRERRGARWSVSGPIGPAAWFGPLQATISSRLPAWGRGLLETSTYYMTFSVMGPWGPLVRLLPIPFRPGPAALLVLERPYLPGQGLFSGFALSPQLSARSILEGYGLTHLRRTTDAVRIGPPAESSGLLIPLSGPRSRSAHEARFLICKPPPPRHAWLRRGAATAADLVLGALRP
jgi:surface antigen-like variable number repeat protein